MFEVAASPISTFFATLGTEQTAEAQAGLVSVMRHARPDDLLRALPGAMRETAPAQSLRTAMAKLDFAEAADQLNILRTQVGTQLPDPAGGRA